MEDLSQNNNSIEISGTAYQIREGGYQHEFSSQYLAQNRAGRDNGSFEIEIQTQGIPLNVRCAYGPTWSGSPGIKIEGKEDYTMRRGNSDKTTVEFLDQDGEWKRFDGVQEGELDTGTKSKTVLLRIGRERQIGNVKMQNQGYFAATLGVKRVGGYNVVTHKLQQVDFEAK